MVHLKCLGYRKKVTNTSNIILNIDGKMCFNNTIAYCINKLYTTIAQNLIAELPKSSIKFNCNSDLSKLLYQKGVTSNNGW